MIFKSHKHAIFIGQDERCPITTRAVLFVFSYELDVYIGFMESLGPRRDRTASVELSECLEIDETRKTSKILHDIVFSKSELC